MDLQFIDEEGVQLAEWLEKILKNYCIDLAKRKLQSQGTTYENFNSSSDSPIHSPFSSTSFSKIEKNIYLFISSIRFDKYEKEFDESVENLLKVEIDYYVGDRKTKRTENFVIQISQSLDSVTPSIEKMLETDKREIDFYTKLVPELEDWALNSGVNIKFAVPTCFFGEYEVDKISKCRFKLDFTFPNENAYDNCSETNEILPRIETRTIMIVHDLEKINFRVKDDNKLGIEEIKAVLRELGKIHAVSWAYQSVWKKPLTEKWPFLLRPKQAVPVCVTLIEEGISSLLKSLKTKYGKDGEHDEIRKRLKIIQPKLTSILYVLLTPPKQPLPSCLIHLDLQCKNITFRNINGDLMNDNHKLQVDQIECRLTQWKLVSLGSPMHDVAFLLLTSLTTEDRRKYTSQLISYYFKIFWKTAKYLGVQVSFKINYLQSEYEKSLFLALLLIIGNFEEGMIDIPESILKSFLSALEDVAYSGYL